MSDKKYGIKDIAVDLVKGKIEFSPPQDQKSRLDICNACPKLDKKIMQCTACGCFVKAKVKFKLSSCPLGKW